MRTEQNRTEQNRTEQNRTEQNRTEQNRTIKKLSVIILAIVLGSNTLLLGQAKYHTIPNVRMKTTSPSGINELPWHYHDNQDTLSFNPFYESNWEMETADERYNAVKEKYLGQKPLFAHQIVNDSAGNLLFFIIDNNIYDKYGYAFDITVYNVNDKAELKPGYNQFDDAITLQHMYHNICIVPVLESCNEFFIIYAMRSGNNTGMLSPTNFYYRQITFISDTDITFTAPEPEVLSLDLTPSCPANTSLSIGVTEYSDVYNDYLLIIQLVGEYRVIRITDEILDTYKELSINWVIDYFKTSNDSGYASTLNTRADAVLFTKDGDTAKVHHIYPGYFESGSHNHKIIYCNFPRDYNLISQENANTEATNYTDNNSIDMVIRGMEQSPNKNYIYFTMNEGSSIYYFDISNYVLNGDDFPATYETCISTISKDFSLSHMETFNDNKIYLYNHDETTNLGSLSSINNPNSPTTTTISHNCFAGIKSKLVCTVNHFNSNKKYLFNHQIDDSDYETNYPSVYCNQPGWSSIGSSATWSPGVNNNPFRSETGVVYFNDDFEIPTGKYIQLNNMEFHFAAAKKAIINTGSTLRLVESTLTSANNCDPTVMWGGVNVLGNSTLNQSSANQGRISVSTGSEISNATIAIKINSGAICQIYGGDFINNYFGVYISPYTHPIVPTYNASIINNATFTTNNTLNNGANALYMLYLHSVKGVGVTRCTFENTRPYNISGNYRGYGMKLYSTDETISNCEFNGLRYGVYANHGTPKISNCNFTNNFRGAYIGSSTNVEIKANDFNGDITFPPASGEPYATYIGGNGTSNTLAKFEENTITGGTVGAYFYNLGPNAVKVKDNAFTSITGASNACAIVAKGKNSNFNGVSYGEAGLEFRCNSFAGNPYALSVIDGNMRKHQGEQGASTGKDYAGNEFDHWGTNSERDFYVDPIIASALDIPQYTYYSHAGNAHNIQYYTTSKVTEAGQAYYYDEDDCDESGGGGIGIGIGIGIKGLSVGDGVEIVETTDTKILLEEFELTELTDAGNTMSLLNETETMSAENSIAIAEDIAKLEGFISVEVATTYIQNNTGNDFAKANALLKNSPLPSSVQSELNIMEMNPALKSIVKQEQVGTNARDLKLMKIAELKQFRGLVINEMVLSSTNSESTNEEKIAIIQFLENDDNLQSKFHLIDINCKMQNFADAKENLETIRQMIQFEDMQYIAEMEDYIELQSIIIDIESGAVALIDAVENNLELISYIADNEDYPGELTAQLLLAETEIRDYEELIRLPEPSMINKNTVVENNPPLIVESFDDIINVYPNPTSASIYVEYAFLNNNNNTHYIEIYGVKGNLIDKIELSQTVGLFTYSKILAAGNYIIKVGENYSQKITVQ
ncbi:MAG: hypothetical protein RBR97_13355 [Bacteroidales bacterium]|nr:hypothetical protein [Bacteroidales bacterium]